MKRTTRILLAAALLLVFTALPAQAKTPKYKFTESTVRVEKEHKLRLTPCGIPATKVKWQSLDENIAKVDKNGVVTGVEIGQTLLTGKYKGLKFKVSVICYRPIPNKTQKRLLREDDNIAVYLQKTHKKELQLKIYNKTKKALGYYIDRVRLTSGGLAYKDETLHYHFIPKGKSMTQEISLTDCGFRDGNDDVHIDLSYYTADHKEHSFRVAANDLDFWQDRNREE